MRIREALTVRLSGRPNYPVQDLGPVRADPGRHVFQRRCVRSCFGELDTLGTQQHDPLSGGLRNVKGELESYPDAVDQQNFTSGDVAGGVWVGLDLPKDSTSLLMAPSLRGANEERQGHV